MSVSENAKQTLKGKKILFQLSGSIAAFKACALISRLVQLDCEVQCVASESALQFIGKATLEGLTGKAPLVDLFESGTAMQHIHAMRWADLVLLCPASANSIAKLANGLGSDLISTLFLAHRFDKPYLLAPAMNSSMYLHPVTQSNLQKLRNLRVRVLESASGVLACGENGWGRLLEPEALLHEIEIALFKPAPKKILITAGGTQEPIDAVRSIANGASGRTGADLTNYFCLNGHSVTLVRSSTGQRPNPHPFLREVTFITAEDLSEHLSKFLKLEEFDLIIHSAAVSDYKVHSIRSESGQSWEPGKGKIPTGDRLYLELERQEKLLGRLREFSSSPNILIVAFKLTETEEEGRSAVLRQQKESSPDLTVHNSLGALRSSQHLCRLYAKDGTELAQCENNEQLAEQIDLWWQQIQGGQV